MLPTPTPENPRSIQLGCEASNPKCARWHLFSRAGTVAAAMRLASSVEASSLASNESAAR